MNNRFLIFFFFRECAWGVDLEASIYLFKNRICSSVLGFSWFLFLQIPSPALENTLSHGTEDAGARSQVMEVWINHFLCRPVFRWFKTTWQNEVFKELLYFRYTSTSVVALLVCCGKFECLSRVFHKFTTEMFDDELVDAAEDPAGAAEVPGAD